MMREETVSTYWVKIYMSGPYDVAAQVIRKYCKEVGLCVTIDRTKFIYTGGEEDGFVVGLINYPRFPKSELEIYKQAETLAIKLLQALHQDSYLVMNPETTYWYTERNV
jgi:hypothetical protein